MKYLFIKLPLLMEKLQEMDNDHMSMVTLSFVESSADQGESFPDFLHFEACTKDGFSKDYESIDSAPAPSSRNSWSMLSRRCSSL